MSLAGAALQTLAAGHVHFGGNEIAFLYAGDFIAEGDYFAAELVSGDERRMNASLGPAVPLVNVEVGAADGGDFDFDQDVRASERGDFDLADLRARRGFRLHHREHRIGHGRAPLMRTESKRQTLYFSTGIEWLNFLEPSMAKQMLPVLVLVCACAPAQLAAIHPHGLFEGSLVSAAIERTPPAVRYDPAYVRIPYPSGDVPGDTGVCTDEVIRSYRAVGVDLQKEVHEDMQQNFSAYPCKWRWFSGKPDSNIDHRRVPNLMVFFQRKGESLPVTALAGDYNPGDLVTYDLGSNVPHIGIVVDRKGGATVT